MMHPKGTAQKVFFQDAGRADTVKLGGVHLLASRTF